MFLIFKWESIKQIKYFFFDIVQQVIGVDIRMNYYIILVGEQDVWFKIVSIVKFRINTNKNRGKNNFSAEKALDNVKT